MIDLNDITFTNHCPIVDNAQSNKLRWLWHKRLGHASFYLIEKNTTIVSIRSDHGSEFQNQKF